MFMPSRRFLGITALGCDCYLASGSRMILEARFGPDQAEEFAAFASSRRDSVFTVVADQLEEDFRLDTMPFLRGSARAQLLERKTAQTYRDTPFHTTASLGRDSDGRRDERVLLMALTNAEALNQWLTPLSGAGIRVSGLYSPPLVAPGLLKSLARRIGARPPRLLLVSVNQSGLRQILVDGDVARFSRLAAVPGADGDDAAEFAANCLSEVNKTQQYLVSLRLLPRDTALPTLILVPPGETAAWSRPGLLIDAVEPVFIDLDEARRAAQLKRISATGETEVATRFADTLWIHAAGARRPKFDFAPPWLREAYRIWRARVALWLGGAAVMLAGIGVGIERWVDAAALDAGAAEFVLQTRNNELAYERIKRSFPPLPATPDQLKASVTAFETLAARTTVPTALLADIGRVLVATPEFRIDKVEWQANAGAAPAGAPASGAGGTVAADAQPAFQETATLQGRIVMPNRAPDLRQDIEVVERTAVRLRGIRGVQVNVIRLPVDLSPGVELRGESDTPQAPAAAGFSIQVTRKVGS